ncbi:competence type IV pilus minor pilin ComGF [Ornithinibacillus salinisoli]|uniref:Competence type IV pilus minor pilin ComGF n=2 Tax=Ornithinibacillus salinisoli TaxID=1848459 RepID=A0ABW4W2X3_9BACI
MYSMLLMVTIITITLPLIIHIIKTVDFESDYDEISVQQFFHLLQNELINIKKIDISSKRLLLTLQNGDKASIEKYNTLVRRQVNDMGHEIYLRDIQNLQFTPLPNGVRVKVMTLQGELYEKVLFVYD